MRNTVQFGFISALLLFSSCGYGKAIFPAEPKGFIERRAEGDPGIVTDQMPFQYAWRDREHDPQRDEILKRGSYSVFIAPVGTKLLNLENASNRLRSQAEQIAEYLRDAIVEEIKGYHEGSVEVLVSETREEADYAFESEITEIGLGSPVLYAATWAIPLPGIATAYDASHTAVLAIEAHYVEIGSGLVVAEMADRRIPKVRILDLKKAISISLPLREIADEWAVQLSEAMSIRLDDGEKVGRAVPFTLIPW